MAIAYLSPVVQKNDPNSSKWKKKIKVEFAEIKRRRPEWKVPIITVMRKRLPRRKSI
jgi:hypothetical protein